MQALVNMKGAFVYWILSSLAIILLIADGKEWCVDSRDNITDCHELHLFCKEGYVISEIELFGGNEDCNLRSSCEGLSPITQADVMSCYWKQNCSVKIPPQTMIFFHNTPPLASFEQKFRCYVTPKSFHVTKLSCTNTKTSNVRQICSQNGKSIVKVDRRGPNMGIIKSHDLWPWDYPKNQRDCNLTFGYPLLPSVSYSTLLTIASLDIGPNDSLLVQYEKKNKKRIKKVKRIGNIKIRGTTSNVQIVFKTKSQRPKPTGKGFVICYKHKVKRKRKNKKKQRTNKKKKNKKKKSKKKGRQSRTKRGARKKKNACTSVMERVDLNDDTIRLQGNSSEYGCQSTAEDEYILL